MKNENNQDYLNYLRNFISKELHDKIEKNVTQTNVHKYFVLKFDEVIAECENSCPKKSCFTTQEEKNKKKNVSNQVCNLNELNISKKSQKFVDGIRNIYGTNGSVKTLKDISSKIKEIGINTCKPIENFVRTNTTPTDINLYLDLFSALSFEDWSKLEKKEEIIKNKYSHKKVFVYISIFLLFIIFGILLNNNFVVSNIQEKNFDKKLLDGIKNITYDRKYVGNKFIDRSVINLLVNNNKIADSKSTSINLIPKYMQFTTYSLQNTYYISSSNWTFAIDSNGEDISSKKYGLNGVQECYSTIGSQNISNNFLTIRFYITNNSDSILTVTGLELNVLDTHTFNAQRVDYGCYSDERDIQKSILLTENDNKYSFDISATELKQKESKWFIITVLAPEQITQNKIYNFNITIEFTNTITKSKSFVNSDKSYFLSVSN